MDFIFISMPYARFISRWFANVPNINLGIMQAYLEERGWGVRTFHFHLDFLPYLEQFPSHVKENLIALTEQFGVEYMGLDYLYASLFFESHYLQSKDRFAERLQVLGLSVDDFEELRRVARSFVDACFGKLAPLLPNTRLVGFSCSHYQLSGSLLLCERIKNAYPHILAIFGGKDCTGAFGDEFMKRVGIVDFVGTGECEVTVESLLDRLRNPAKSVFNVLYRDADGTVRRSPSRPNTSIESLPFPAYDFGQFPIGPSDIILPIEFGRGCPWKRCTFCPDESYHILCQAKSPSRIAAEISHYLGISRNLRRYFILDSDALKNRDAIIALSKKLAGMDLEFIYAEFRAEKMDRDVLKALRDIGTWVPYFQIGIETFSDNLLKLMNKGVTALKNVEVLKAAAELGVSVQFNLFTSFPGMTESDLRENTRVMDLISHILVKDLFSIFPGEFYLPPDCPIFLNADRWGLMKGPESVFSAVFRDLNMPSYSNYPYPYRFRNDEEQYRFSMALRAKVEEIKSRTSNETFMVWRNVPNGMEVEISKNGSRGAFLLSDREATIYAAACERIRHVDDVSSELRIPADEISAVLETFEQRGITLLSPDRKEFLSLALRAGD